ncbi:MAG: hypothetical protein Q9204_005792 [Flavoplaca sp. TL-2023a]
MEYPHGLPDQSQYQLKQPASKYEYQPLQKSQIRLLTILSVDNDGIRCNLERSEFEHSPAYDALSYAWGAQDSNQPSLHCSGGSISISPHLHSALKRFYRKWEIHDAPDRLSRPRIWVDAICINQNDHIEKAHQVTRMARIYAHARRVIVWLGEHENESRLAMQLLQDYATAFPDIVRDESGSAMQLFSVSADDLLPLRQSQAITGSWQALSDLCDRPYFQRRWVLQELASEREICVLCGEDSVPWSTLVGLVMASAVTELHDILEGADIRRIFGAISMAHIWFLANREKSSFDIVSLFYIAQWTQCTEKVDRLLSLIGILPPQYGAISDVAEVFDYHQPYWVIFLRFVKSVLRINLDPLSLAGACRTRNPSLPSWCPDFTSRLSTMYGKNMKDACAASEMPVLCNYPTDQTLCCRGFRLGTVLDRVYGEELPPPKRRYSQDESKNVLSWERKCYDLATRALLSDRARLEEAFSKVLVVGERRFRAIPQCWNCQESVSEIYTLWKQTLWRNSLTGNSKHDGPDAVDTYGMLAVRNGDTSKFFATFQGQLGFSSSEVQPNDVIYVLYGGRTPFVLRPSKIDNTMQLVGDAHVEGVMYGEALTANNKQPDEWVNLV